MQTKVKKVKAITITEDVHREFQQLQLKVSMDISRRISSPELIKMLVDNYKSKVI